MEPGQTLSHYRILHKLGAGGMGVVYLAEDTSLKRKVALKILQQSLAANRKHLERFQREAEAVAALNHPHIVTIYSVEEAEGTHFLTMELVDGETLDGLLLSGGLPLDKVFEIGIALSDALAAAHEKGVIHRDLKPANVMLMRDGWVKVLDFGLASLAREPVLATAVADASQATTHAMMLTREGSLVGTVPYMSPEQLQGQQIDHQTDIFSLGVVLYELAVGQRPFRGTNTVDMVSSIMRDTPLPVTELREELPPHLGRIIARCLEKDPEQRIQSARDVRNELRALRSEVESDTARRASALRSVRMGPRPRRGLRAALVATVPVAMLAAAVWLRREIPSPRVGAGQPQDLTKAHDVATLPQTHVASLAVLPFADMSPEKDQEYFSDGLAEELLNELAAIHGLRVVARTSSFQFKGKNEDLKVIGEKLNVSGILEGSVRKIGKRLRISAQLVSVADGFRLWSETYDRELGDILTVQEDIAHSVAGALKVTLSGNDMPESRASGRSADAYNAYLQGEYFLRRGTAGDNKKAAGYFRKAIALDPDYALAWVGLSKANKDPGQQRDALEAARRALELDGNLAEAHAQMAELKNAFDWDWTGADAECQRALALKPGSAEVVRAAATQAATLGRIDEAVALLRHAVELDPLYVRAQFDLGLYLWYAGWPNEAQAAYKKALEISPEFGGAHYGPGLVYLTRGELKAAVAEMEKEKEPALRLQGLALAHYALGRRQEADQELGELAEKFWSGWAFQIAQVYAFRGESEPAFAWLERAYRTRDPGLSEIKGHPLLKSLELDPRYAAILVKLHLSN